MIDNYEELTRRRQRVRVSERQLCLKSGVSQATLWRLKKGITKNLEPYTWALLTEVIEEFERPFIKKD